MREGWLMKKLKEVCEKITDGTHQTPKYFDKGIIFLSSRNVTSGKINWENIKYIDEKQHLEMHKRVAPRVNDILLAKNGTTGVAAMVDRDVIFDIYVSLAHIRVLDEITPEFMLYFINSPIAKSQFNKRLKGVGVPNLHLNEIREVEIPFPKSVPEQKQIVAILDQAFEAIDQAKTNIEKNIENAKELFQSKLNEIFSQKGDGWEEKSFKELSTRIGDGLHGTPKYDEEGDYYFINGNNLNDGLIEIKENTKKINEKEFEKHKRELTLNTVLISINGTLGKVAFYNGEPVILGKSACYINFNKEVNKHYIKYLVKSSLFFKNMASQSTGATIKNFSLKSMRDYKIFLPPLDEQDILVKDLILFEKKIMILENHNDQKINSLEELKKSILQKAFAGELTGKELAVEVE